MELLQLILYYSHDVERKVLLVAQVAVLPVTAVTAAELKVVQTTSTEQTLVSLRTTLDHTDAGRLD